MNAPMCFSCNSNLNVIKADAGVVQSIPYWYCKTCKEEVDHQPYSVDVQINEQNPNQMDVTLIPVEELYPKNFTDHVPGYYPSTEARKKAKEFAFANFDGVWRDNYKSLYDYKAYLRYVASQFVQPRFEFLTFEDISTLIFEYCEEKGLHKRGL